jgi:hypothetical protein
MRGSVEAFNIVNHVNYTVVEQRAFLVGAPVSGVTPLIFQDGATVAAEALNTRPVGTDTAAAADLARERRIQVGWPPHRLLRVFLQTIRLLFASKSSFFHSKSITGRSLIPYLAEPTKVLP